MPLKQRTETAPVPRCHLVGRATSASSSRNCLNMTQQGTTFDGAYLWGLAMVTARNAMIPAILALVKAGAALSAANLALAKESSTADAAAKFPRGPK